MDIKPGELPGIDAAIVARRPDGTVHRIEEPMTAAELAAARLAVDVPRLSG